jgi:Flp pilus assembly pilin Flp
MWTALTFYVRSFGMRLQISRDEGQALVEYTLILALVSVVSITVLATLGTDIKTQLETVVAAL